MWYLLKIGLLVSRHNLLLLLLLLHVQNLLHIQHLLIVRLHLRMLLLLALLLQTYHFIGIHIVCWIRISRVLLRLGLKLIGVVVRLLLGLLWLSRELLLGQCLRLLNNRLLPTLLEQLSKSTQIKYPYSNFPPIFCYKRPS